jgi:hypothetical protein
MEAHEVKIKTKVVVIDDNVITPPGSIPIKKGDKITIKRIDGMYCNAVNESGNIVYVAAWTEVEELNND